MLLAVDTNVLARALVATDDVQSKKAVALLRDQDVFVAETVLLETEWLLRSHLAVSREAINSVLSKLLSLKNVHFDNITKVGNAVAAHKTGMDFADALHLFSAVDCDELLSFDRDFAKRAARLTDAVPVRHP